MQEVLKPVLNKHTEMNIIGCFIFQVFFSRLAVRPPQEGSCMVTAVNTSSPRIPGVISLNLEHWSEYGEPIFLLPCPCLFKLFHLLIYHISKLKKTICDRNSPGEENRMHLDFFWTVELLSAARTWRRAASPAEARRTTCCWWCGTRRRR